MSDGNELAELLWENRQEVVHGPPQPFGTGGSSRVQEKHPGGDNNNMMAFTKAGMGMAPSLRDLASGLHARHENRDDDTFPWIHCPINIIHQDDDNTAPALTTADYCSDFFSELQEVTVSVGNLQQHEMAHEIATGAGNDEPWHLHQQKRKVQSECSASQDEDLDDESGALLSSASTSMKRSRTAEAHNLSERRRRDRINEKLHALRQLIPNCNKTDKASMLDEVIEYLKTLQLQVQMMSMGTGLCIPPVLLAPAMQHLQISPMAHFPHLGMGLWYRMGVFDMNITGSIPISRMPSAHFPCQMIPGASQQGFGIPGVNAMPMFGVPGQVNPSSGSSVSPFTSLAGLPVRQNPAPQVSGTTARNSETTTTKFEQGS